MPQLNSATVRTMAVPVPAYDRSTLTIGVVHVGVGGFHRAHQAMYLDRLLARGATDWAICGVGMLPADAAMRDVLHAQDGLYTLVQKHPDGTLEPRVIGSIVEYLFAPDDPEAVISRMAAPTTRIVSLTITEGGYPVDDADGTFRPDDPAVRDELAEGDSPGSVFGLVTQALARRRAAGLAPFTVMSCDNIPGNGDLTRTAFSGFAEAVDAELGAWVRANVAFPNSMVDRITPATTDADRRQLTERFDIVDGWPVVCEPYEQWVLEDRFSDGRPAWEDVGVQVVDDVTPYELMKLRLLNAGHQTLAYLGYLAGHRYSDEAAGDPALAEFLLGYLEREATPTLPPMPDTDLAGYRHTLLARFRNPYVRDPLVRLCAYSSDRIPKFVLPVIRAQRQADGEFARATLVVAAWARYAEGVDEQGEVIDVVDQRADDVTAAARRARDNPPAFLTDTGVFGDLASDEEFVAAFSAALTALHERGAAATYADPPGVTSS